jgi:hypothetical protein
MIEIQSVDRGSVVGQYPELAAILDGCLPSTSPAFSTEEGPFIQLSNDEIEASRIDLLLGYEGIAAANAPIGLPGLEKKQQLSSGPLLFSIEGLERHLEVVSPSVASLFRLTGSMDALVALRGDDLSAEEYLVGGLLELCRYCRERCRAMIIRW